MRIKEEDSKWKNFSPLGGRRWLRANKIEEFLHKVERNHNKTAKHGFISLKYK